MCAIAGLGRIAGAELYPLARLFHDILLNPGDYWWLYAMLFSTVVPTVLHLTAACFSMGAWLTPSARGWMRRTIGDDDAVATVAGPLAIGFYWTLCLLIPLVALWGLYLLANAVAPGFLWAYLQWLQDVACWVNAGSCPA